MIGPRQLNRWTLARQLLLERAELDAVTAIERLAGMQAQHPPAPYIGLWSRLHGFRREELEAAVMDGRVFKATLMRGTLHLISERQFDRYRVACRHDALVARALKQMAEGGADAEVLRQEIVALLRDRPQTQAEVLGALAHRVPPGMSTGLAFGVLHLTGATMNVAEDARFDHGTGSRYRLAPPPVVDPDTALREVVSAYLRAFGPATRADISQWLGQPVAIFGPALEQLDVITFQAEDGRSLLDLPDAPRPDPDVPVPVRFLPKWDNLLLAHDRRERVLPQDLRRTVIGKNGDVLSTFLVDGMVAGAWQAARRGRAIMTLTAFGRLPARSRREVVREGEALLAWLRPDAEQHEVRWAPA